MEGSRRQLRLSYHGFAQKCAGIPQTARAGTLALQGSTPEVTCPLESVQTERYEFRILQALQLCGANFCLRDDAMMLGWRIEESCVEGARVGAVPALAASRHPCTLTALVQGGQSKLLPQLREPWKTSASLKMVQKTPTQRVFTS